jgi:hypothetical protein
VLCSRVEVEQLNSGRIVALPLTSTGTCHVKRATRQNSHVEVLCTDYTSLYFILISSYLMRGELQFHNVINDLRLQKQGLSTD